MKRAALHNLGCKVNSYEAEAMLRMLSEAGYEIVDFDRDIADVYIINTCSVTNIADRKSRQMLHKAKKMNPDSIVIAAGCYAQSAAEDLEIDDAVDIIVGNNKKKDIVSVIEEYCKEKENHRAVIDIGHTEEYEDLEIEKVSEHTRAYIKIQDGCNQFCSYCIIPYTRGRIRSRQIESIVTEVKRLAENGYKEVVLTGIHLSSYGAELDKKITLLDVIKQLHEIEGLERIRLGSLEPRIVTEEFVQELSNMKKVCPHFHLSLQSGCDTVLKRMNRKYTTKEYLKGCEILRKYYGNPAITTDVIVGFPGETQEEFEITRKFLNQVRFYEMHIFKYSRRKGTVADRMENQVPDDIKTVRSNELLELDRKLSEQFRKEYIGARVPVLFEEEVHMDGESYYVGHTAAYIKCAVKSEKNLINTICDVELQGINEQGIMTGNIR